MSNAERARLLEICEPQVIGFRLGDYALRHDLDWLDRLRSQGAVEGVILHASRVLEVLAKGVFGQLSDRSNRVYENINELQKYHNLPRSLSCCLHQQQERRGADYSVVLASAFWIACRIPIGLIGNTSRAFLSRTTVGFFKPSIKCRPTSKLAGVTRASHRLDR
jgi:hypothetical protein